MYVYIYIYIYTYNIYIYIYMISLSLYIYIYIYVYIYIYISRSLTQGRQLRGFRLPVQAGEGGEIHAMDARKETVNWIRESSIRILARKDL